MAALATGLPFVQVRRVAVQSVAAGVNTVIVFDTTDEDRFSMVDPAHRSRLTIPSELGDSGPGSAGGVYFGWVNAAFSQVQESTRRLVGLMIDGNPSDIEWQDSRAGINSPSVATQCLTTGPIRVPSGHFVELLVRHDSLSAPRDVTAQLALLGPFVP